jgi:hypothetical protein
MPKAHRAFVVKVSDAAPAPMGRSFLDPLNELEMDLSWLYRTYPVGPGPVDKADYARVTALRQLGHRGTHRIAVFRLTQDGTRETVCGGHEEISEQQLRERFGPGQYEVAVYSYATKATPLARIGVSVQ